MIDKLTQMTGQRFRSFGGGQKSNWNPVVNALKDKPLQFAAGVDIKEVVAFILDQSGIDRALEVIASYGSVDGDHHKAWVIDQVARKLTGDGYDAWVAGVKAGEDGPETYSWEVGIAP
jgi:hypothetical protein